MPLQFSSKGSSKFKQCPAGTYVAVCDMVVYLGLQPGSGQFPAPKEQLYLRFQIPALRVDYEKDGKQLSGPQVIGRTFTASMHKKSNLRAILENWRSKAFSEQEASEFDIAKVVGAGCMLNVVQKEVNGEIYSNIGSISGLPAGVASPKSELPLVLYTGENPDEAKNLPEWLQKKLSEQVKPQASNATGIYAEPDHAGSYDFTDAQPPLDAYDSEMIDDQEIVPF